jgi:ubiquinone/menaquinone biosynthesis C-methylase UbiE
VRLAGFGRHPDSREEEKAMENAIASVERHYGRGEILDSILRALTQMGKGVSQLAPADLAPVDEFHIRGREATVELAGRASLKPGLGVLDVGSGLGGSARYLASEHQCRVTGIDLTQEYVEVARTLADLVGLGGQVEFRQCSALAMPFENGAFDVVWTEHVQMNIADKRAFYGEIARVIKSGGRFAFHDIFQGAGGEPHFPVPWADESSISFLATPDAIRDTLVNAGLRILDWEDRSQRSLQWFAEVVERVKQSGPPPLGIHLLMGATARAKLENMVRNLRENRIIAYQAVAEKT